MGIIACQKTPEAKQDACGAHRIPKDYGHPSYKFAYSDQISAENRVGYAERLKAWNKLGLAATQFQYSPNDERHAQKPPCDNKGLTAPPGCPPARAV